MKLTEQRAWSLILQMGWKENNYDYKKISEWLYLSVKPEVIKLLKTFVGNRVADIYLVVKNHEETTGVPLQIGSDDGFNDVAYHVVGLGEDEWKTIIKNPKALETRYNAKGHHDGWHESFAYAFMEPEKPLTTQQKITSLRRDIERTQQEIGHHLEIINNRLGELVNYSNRLSDISKEIG